VPNTAATKIHKIKAVECLQRLLELSSNRVQTLEVKHQTRLSRIVGKGTSDRTQSGADHNRTTTNILGIRAIFSLRNGHRCVFPSPPFMNANRRKAVLP